MSDINIIVHVPELAVLANAIRILTEKKLAAPHPTTPAQTAQQTKPASAPAQVAPTAAPTAPISPTRAYSTARTTPAYSTAPTTPATPRAPAYPSYQQPAAPVYQPQQPAPAANPASAQQLAAPAPVAVAPAYTIEQLARAAGALADAGKRREVCDLITKTFGVQALQQIPKNKYGAFATALRGLGARI